MISQDYIRDRLTDYQWQYWMCVELRFCTMGCSVVGFLCVPVEELQGKQGKMRVGVSDAPARASSFEHQ